ncbi:MAG: hypothetical protein P1V34_14530 [Alphaproteobacteria bacterium]|nr:hypothetical protein [Alphaproteobacteria bacterium]
MAQYTARLMDAKSGNEGVYDFEGPEDLMSQTPIRIVRHFMEYVDRDVLPTQHVDYELNAALKNQQRNVVTAMGNLHFDHGEDPAPFMLMIAAKQK